MEIASCQISAKLPQRIAQSKSLSVVLRAAQLIIKQRFLVYSKACLLVISTKKENVDTQRQLPAISLQSQTSGTSQDAPINHASQLGARKR